MNMLKEIIRKAKEYDALCESINTPPQQSTVPPMPPVKPPSKTNPPNVGSSVQSPKKQCVYETPCGWCAKWDKKCDCKIGGGNDAKPRKKKNAALEYIKSGKGMPDNDIEWFL